MIKKTLWKDILRAIKNSKGRFISLFFLMALGSFALVGLKVTGPDMERTASRYLERHQVMDLTVLASHQFSQADKQELDTLKGAHLEYGHLLDVSLTSNQKSLRLYSVPKKVSKPVLVKGSWPKRETDLVLSSSLAKNYQIGDELAVTSPMEGLLTTTHFQVVGFANSSEVWSKSNLGSSSTGDGSLYAYAFVNPNVFKSAFNLLRIRFSHLRLTNAFSKDYQKKVTQNQAHLDNLLKDNGQKRYDDLQNQYDLALKNGRAALAKETVKLAASEENLTFLEGSALQEAKHQIEQGKQALAKEEKQLEQVQATKDKLEKPSYLTYNRSTLPGGEGYHTYATSTTSISNVGNIFPVVLYLVAALVAFTTMTRYVDEERTSSGVLISEKLASYYKVKPGDQLILTDRKGQSYKVTIKQVIDMTVGHYLIMSDTYFKNHFKGLEAAPAYLIKVKDKDSKHIKETASDLLTLKAIRAVSQNVNHIKSVQLVVTSLNQVMTLLVFLSILLAIVILYNLTTINIAERIRELSTIKVLGFYDQEVTLYIYRETISLSLVGILLGIYLGKGLHTYIMTMISTGDIQFGVKVDAYVYLVPILVILSLLAVLGIWVNRHLKKVDMLEALKSID